MADYATIGIPARCYAAMSELGLDPRVLYTSHGWAISEVRVYHPNKRLWNLFPRHVAPPSRRETVWGVLVTDGPFIALSGEACAGSPVHHLATITHKLMQQAAFMARSNIEQCNSATRRAFDAICDVGLLQALEGHAGASSHLEEQRRHARASCLAVCPNAFRAVVNMAYGGSGILLDGGAALCAAHARARA
jgi:hypothetical protein